MNETTNRRMKSPGVVLLTVAASMLAATCGWSQNEVASDAAGGRAQQSIPDLRLGSDAGRLVSLREFSGRVVVYDFWATWCTPCHVQVEILEGIYSRAREAGVEFVAIATGEPEEIVRRYLEKSPYPYPGLLDPDERLATALEVLGLPTLIVADRQGRVVWRQTGLTDGETLIEAMQLAGADWPE